MRVYLMNNKKILSGFCVFFMLVLCSPAVNSIEVYKACCNKSNIEAPQDAARHLRTEAQGCRGLKIRGKIW